MVSGTSGRLSHAIRENRENVTKLKKSTEDRFRQYQYRRIGLMTPLTGIDFDANFEEPWNVKMRLSVIRLGPSYTAMAFEGSANSVYAVFR